MPRYWMPGFSPYNYCWADNPSQARESMKVYFSLLGRDYFYSTHVTLAINQYNDQIDPKVHEPDFRVKKDA